MDVREAHAQVLLGRPAGRVADQQEVELALRVEDHDVLAHHLVQELELRQERRVVELLRQGPVEVLAQDMLQQGVEHVGLVLGAQP